MSHEIEIIDNVAQMAYVGDVPWHGLGTRVPSDLTPVQILDAAGLNWTVRKVEALAYDEQTDKVFNIDRSALIRSSDNSVLDVVSNDWNPVQNIEAFEFFNEFVEAGDMEMHTAGSLKGGQIVWCLARVKESFELFQGDQIDSYLLFTNFHRYGFSTDARFTPIRVVCNNTLTLSLNSKVERMMKFSHRRVFDPENVKDMLGIATDKLQKYREMASFLGSKQAKNEDIVTYFTRVFPLTGNGKNKDISKNAGIAYDILHTQPGAEYAEGSWWQPVNAVTYMIDHKMGRSQDTRLTSAWYGSNRNLKLRALDLALEFANAS